LVIHRQVNIGLCSREPLDERGEQLGEARLNAIEREVFGRYQILQPGDRVRD